MAYGPNWTGNLSTVEDLLEALPFIHVCLPMADLVLQWQSGVVATVTMDHKAQNSLWLLLAVQQKQTQHCEATILQCLKMMNLV